MTASTASMPHQCKLATSASGNASEPFEYVSNTVGKRAEIVRRNGLRGTREMIAEDAKDGTYTVSGDLTLEPTPEDLAIWLPRVLGAAANGTSYALAETLPTFNLAEDKVAKVMTWAGCKVDRAVIRAQKGGLLTVVLSIEGLTEAVGNAGTFPALTITYSRPYIMHEIVLTLNSTAREVESFELTINNNLTKDRHLNSQTRVNLPEGERQITLQTVVPYSPNNTDLYDLGAAGASTNTIVCTSGNYSTTFTFGKLQAPTEAPATQPPNEIMETFTWTACKTSTTASLVVTHDANGVS